MSKAYYLGIDTSNYTTSLAVVNEQAELVANIKQLLPVKTGERVFGNRSSFWHVKNLPLLMKETSEKIPDLGSFCVRLRSAPAHALLTIRICLCFGRQWPSRELNRIASDPCFGLSHQENHIWAGLYSAGGPQAEQFWQFTYLVVHQK